MTVTTRRGDRLPNALVNSSAKIVRLSVRQPWMVSPRAVRPLSLLPPGLSDATVRNID